MQWSLNSTRFSRSSVKLTLAGIQILGGGPPEWTESIGGDLMYFNSPFSVGKVIGELKNDISIPMLPEMLDSVKSSIGIGYGETALPLVCSLYEPGNPAGVYTISNDACFLSEDAFKAPAEGAMHTLKLISGSLTNWNGITALDMAARATDVTQASAIFASFGLAL